MEQEEVLDGKDLSEAMDETIASTLKDIQSRNPDALKEDAEVTPVETVKADKPRDPEGKFTKSKESATPEKADTPSPVVAPASDQAVAEADKPLVTTKGVPIDLTRPPSSWKPAAKAAWNALPEPVRADIHRREMEGHHAYAGVKENADLGQAIKTAAEPYRMLIDAEGGKIEQAFSQYLKTASIFRTGTPQQKLQTLFSIDQQFGGGLNQHFQKSVQEAVSKALGNAQPSQPTQPQSFNDPRVDQLVAKLEEQERARQADEVRRRDEESRVSNAATERFLTAKDDKGQALYPFVDNVLDDMSARVGILRGQNPSIGHEEILKQAYEASVWANPETRAVLMSQQQATANQPAETLRKVEAAKRASAVNVPKRGALPATGPAKTLDETIRETGQALGMF